MTNTCCDDDICETGGNWDGRETILTTVRNSVFFSFFQVGIRGETVGRARYYYYYYSLGNKRCVSSDGKGTGGSNKKGRFLEVWGKKSLNHSVS